MILSRKKLLNEINLNYKNFKKNLSNAVNSNENEKVNNRNLITIDTNRPIIGRTQSR